MYTYVSIIVILMAFFLGDLHPAGGHHLKKERLETDLGPSSRKVFFILFFLGSQF